MACHSDLVGQILYFCVPIKILDQKSILSEIHVHGPWSFNAAEEVALGSIKAIIPNLLYLLSSFHIVPVIFASCNSLPVGIFPVLGVNSLGFILTECWCTESEWGAGIKHFPAHPKLCLLFRHSLGSVPFAMSPHYSVAVVSCFSPRLQLSLLCWSACSLWNCSSFLLKDIQDDAGSRSLS